MSTSPDRRVKSSATGSALHSQDVKEKIDTEIGTKRKRRATATDTEHTPPTKTVKTDSASKRYIVSINTDVGNSNFLYNNYY